MAFSDALFIVRQFSLDALFRSDPWVLWRPLTLLAPTQVISYLRHDLQAVSQDRLCMDRSPRESRIPGPPR